MQLDPQIITAVTIIIVVAIVVIGLVAVLAPAALSSFVRPLLETIAKLIDALTQQKDKSKPPDDDESR